MHRATKIVATLGPASDIKAFSEVGVNVFRINASHGTHEEHALSIQAIREQEKTLNIPLPILFDLQGPKFRIGVFQDANAILRTGSSFILDLNRTPGNHTRVCLPHPELIKNLTQDTELLLNDGQIRLKVLKHHNDSVETLVVNGGVLSSRKGVNFPGKVIPISAMTEKDQHDLAFALDHGVDIIAISFVQKAQDVRQVRELTKNSARLIAKIEKPSAVEDLDEIIDVSDGLMVARGDLGVEVPLENVPWMQKKIIQKARDQGKPVIVATQMLESMIENPIPTRAEVSDVATAVFEGADAVMLSAESAVGKYPVESIKVMDRVIRSTEKSTTYCFGTPPSVHTVADAIAASARQMAETLYSPVIVTFTETGYTTVRASRQRPQSLILSLTPRLSTARFMNLIWGVFPIVTEDVATVLEMEEVAVKLSFLKCPKNSSIIVIAGIPFGRSGTTNLLRII